MSDAKRVELFEQTTVLELSRLMDVPAAHIVRAGMDLSRLLTIQESLSFDEATKVANQFGFVAKRRGEVE